MRLALGIEYDGTCFAGWQVQPVTAQVETVQGTVEAALSQIAGADIHVLCSGRTDAGVHALQQVIHFDTDATRPKQAWVRGLNSLLPKTIAVQWVLPVSDIFHARHSALERRYTYALLSDPIRPSILRNQVGWLHHALDVKKMQQAAALLVGEHDFSSFRASQCQAKGPVRYLSEMSIVQCGPYIYFTLQANGFLHHMVRNIVGALVYVGMDRWSVAHFQAVFEARDRTQGAPTFAPEGLYFCGATYPAQMNIPKPLVLTFVGG
jgi:tRNA pseudouridine38-40 synthase